MRDPRRAVALCQLDTPPTPSTGTSPSPPTRLPLLTRSPVWDELLQTEALQPGDDLLAHLKPEQRQPLEDALTRATLAQSTRASCTLTLQGQPWLLELTLAEHAVLLLSPHVRAASPAHISHADQLGPIARQVLDLLPNPVFVKDRDHRWILFNESFCQLLGLPPEALLGRSDYDLFPDEQADVFWQKDEELFDTQQPVINEEALTTAEGSLRWLLTHKIPVILANEEPGLVGVITDITRRKLAEDQLLRNVEARDHAISASLGKSRFLASMSHELRTPLNAIIGYASLLDEELDELGTEGARADLARIMRAAHQLLSLIDDVLDLSHVEADMVRLHTERFPLKPLIDEVIESILPSLHSANQSLILHLAPEPTHVTLDRARLKQILLNLLSNAVKFAPQGVISLHASRQEDDLVIEVIDGGPGISLQDTVKIFQPFERLHHDASLIPGTGLGLGLSRHMAHLMGGDIALYSQPGEGACFRVRLPLTSSGSDGLTPTTPLPTIARMRARLDRLARSQAPTILIVDDDEAAYDLLERFSKPLHLSLIWTPSPTRCVELARTCSPSLIVLDIIMPERDGWSVLSELQSTPDLAHIPVLILTFSELPTLHHIAHENVHFMRKPISKNQWARHIRSLNLHSHDTP